MSRDSREEQHPMSQHLKTFCVVNPNSANGSTRRLWPEIHTRIQAAIGEVGVGLTEAPGHATELARQALEQGYEQIVAVGGDGTNNEVVNGFFRQDGTPLAPEAVFAFVTRGTGGDFRRIFGFDLELQTFVDNLAGRDAPRADVGRLQFRDHDGQRAVRYFINIASFGIGGLVDEKVNAASKVLGGKASFMIATVKALLQYRNQTVRMVADDGEPRTLKVNNVAVANGQYFGGGMWIAPMARIDDGWLEVASASKRTRSYSLSAIYRQFIGSLSATTS